MIPAERVYSVAIVVDPGFGSRLKALAETQHVWAVKSAANDRAAAELREGDDDFSFEKGVTMFAPSVGDSPVQWCADIIGTVEEHHGRHSHVPPVTVLDIYGAEPTPQLRRVLARYRFTHVVEKTEGFQARARSAI
jgi:hypothetical protein